MLNQEEVKKVLLETNETLQDLVASGQEFPEAVTVTYDTILEKHGEEMTKEVFEIFTKAIEMEKLKEITEEIFEEENVCEHCGGTGEVEAGVWDLDSHQYQPTGTQKCECQMAGCCEDDEYDQDR